LASTRKDAKTVERECKARQKHKFNVELLPRQELLKSFSLNASCAILSQAAEVNPLKLTLALVRSAQRQGLKVFSHTKVKTYCRQATESVVTTDDNVRVHAQHVVFATGYESQQFLKQKEVHLVSSYAIASTPGTEFLKNETSLLFGNRPALIFMCEPR
jgi:glycine/D-amino acid oxidase-like deaminating enzyme